MPSPSVADVCLVVEGAYPYVQGGVSSWSQDLIKNQSHLTFHILAIFAPGAELTPRYPLPANVCGLTNVFAGQMPIGVRSLPDEDRFLRALFAPVSRVMTQGSAADLKEIVALLAPHRHEIGRHLLLDSRAAWDAFNAIYTSSCQGASYLNSFWGWRTLAAGLFATMIADLPPARIYHTVSTGYAGLLAARASFETGRPAMLTEHGIYTNERRLEILAAPWLAVDDSANVSIDGDTNKVKQLWINTFVSYAKACYDSCSHIITLFEGNHALQLEDGASPDRLHVIPNGIDAARYAEIPREAAAGSGRYAIALLGRVVPIKDVKTYIRSCAILIRSVPDVTCYILGAMDEDPAYAHACQALVVQLGLQRHLVFAGMVNLVQWYGKLDVVVLTSVSESQPLVILEGGAAGVPSVAPDVGACRELIMGRSDEDPYLGAGGRVTPIGSPAAYAEAIADLLRDDDARRACGEVMRKRVERYYDKAQLHRRYAELYDELLRAGPAAAVS